jgi:DNA-binding response OmpR family regulator
MNQATILMVEDDPIILRTNREVLEMEGYRVLEAENLTAGRSIIEREPPDLIILDIMLPDGNGLEYCEELRGKSSVPILFLSALGSYKDIASGLHAGGDNYLAKPYDMEVFLAQIEAMLRRSRLAVQEETDLYFGTLKLDTVSRRAFLNNEDLLLKPREFSLLEVLLKNNNSFVPAEKLYEKAWGMNAADDTRTVKEHISRLRKKLGDSSPVSIESERGKGYCMKQLN